MGLLRKEYTSKWIEVREQLSYLDQLRVCKLVNQTTERLLHQVKTKNDKTIRWLIKSQLGEGTLRHSTIINLLDTEINDLQKDVLCRGLNFGVPPKLSSEEIAAEFELCWQQLEDIATTKEKRSACKASLANIAQRYGSAKIDRTGYPLRKEHLRTISELKRDNNIILTRPDKGNGVVVLNRDDYNKKMLAILSDTDKFERIGEVETHDNTTLQERALQAYLLRAMKNGHITAEVYEEIRPVGSTRPRMYGVPKVHKVGTPLRPILSMTNAPQHQMARWLVRVLTPVVDKYSKHTIKDTFEFCDHIEKFAAQSDATDLFLCSFDITSLFTNVPLEETLKICLETLYRDADVPKPSIPEDILEKLLLKATKDVEFSFDGVMYRQIDGIAMGSPLGPTLANIFVGHCESILAEKAQWPLLYDRFVDDTFSIFESEENAEKFFKVLNGMHPALKFTIEEEENQCLPFMDVFLQRSGNNFYPLYIP